MPRRYDHCKPSVSLVWRKVCLQTSAGLGSASLGGLALLGFTLLDLLTNKPTLFVRESLFRQMDPGQKKRQIKKRDATLAPFMFPSDHPV